MSETTAVRSQFAVHYDSESGLWVWLLIEPGPNGWVLVASGRERTEADAARTAEWRALRYRDARLDRVC